MISSGGISSIADLIALAEVAQTAPNAEGSVVGKALYANRFTLPDALEALQGADVLAEAVGAHTSLQVVGASEPTTERTISVGDLPQPTAWRGPTMSDLRNDERF